MRLSYARWLLEFTDEHGIGLGRGEFAEVEAAEFRVYGPGRLTRSEAPAMEADVEVGCELFPWEPEVLGSIAHELLPVLVAGAGSDGE